MHMRLVERRDVIQEERWTALALSMDRASAGIERALAGIDRNVTQGLIERVRMTRAYVSERGYTREHLQHTLTMLGAIADSLSGLMIDLRLRMDSSPDRTGRGIDCAVDRSGPP